MMLDVKADCGSPTFPIFHITYNIKRSDERDRRCNTREMLILWCRVIRLNDYLLEQECKKEEVRCKRDGVKSRIPITLKSVANLSNQLLRAGTSIGANNAEATNAISKADFKSKSFIALKEARESLYWIELLHRNNYLDVKQYTSIHSDCEELVKVLVHRCKKINDEGKSKM